MKKQPLASYLKDWGVYLKAETLRMFFLGFSAGLPPLLILGTLSFCLREASIDLKTIGFFSWIGLVYAFKWVWAPMVDHITLPLVGRLLGHRRGWLFFAQIGVALSLLGMGLSDPQQHLSFTILFALLTSFFSATQDISLDAYRIESSSIQMQGALSAMYQAGYRLAMIWAGAGAFALATFAAPETSAPYSYQAWRFAYFVMAASVLIGWVTVFFSPEPFKRQRQWSAELSVLGRLKQGFYAPISDFFKRYQHVALLILLLISCYRISDVMMGVMANPFYHDIGFSKEEVAWVSKVFGVVMTLLGAFIGGVITMRLGVLKTLFLGAVLSSATNVLFSVLAHIGHSIEFLMVTVSADNLAAGIASAAFVAYLSSLTNLSFSATQYALFSSLMVLLPKGLAGFSGVMVEATDYSTFFICTALIGIPVMLLIAYLMRKTPEINTPRREVGNE